MVTALFNSQGKEPCPLLASIWSVLLAQTFYFSNKVGGWVIFAFLLVPVIIFPWFCSSFPPLATACSLLPAGQFANETAVPIWTQSGQHLPGNWSCTKAACVALPHAFVSSLVLVAITHMGTGTAGLGRTQCTDTYGMEPKQWHMSSFPAQWDPDILSQLFLVKKCILLCSNTYAHGWVLLCVKIFSRCELSE